MDQHHWDPGHYLLYGEERGRPFWDLLARVGADAPRSVVDLGCGPGNLTRDLAERWPGAEVLGVDSSAEMISRARAEQTERVRFAEADLRSWRPEQPVDVLVSNATLQWVPGHLDLLAGLVAHVAPGGWFAFQVPGNLAAPSHTLLARLGGDPRFAPYLQELDRRVVHDPQTYLTALLDLGCSVDAWETTYLHLLTGADPVFRWISGTGARPTLQALPDGLRTTFEQEYRQLLREAYPQGQYGTVLPFRRVFAVARLPA